MFNVSLLFETLPKIFTKKSAAKTEPILDFVGIWANKDIDVDECRRKFRKGRQFNVD